MGSFAGLIAALTIPNDMNSPYDIPQPAKSNIT